MLGTIRLIAAFIEHLQTRPAATIITVSSGLGFTPLKVTPSYNASKAAIHLLTEIAAAAVRRFHRGIQGTSAACGTDRSGARPARQPVGHAAEQFVSEVVDILENQPDADEIQVENVKLLPAMPKCAASTTTPWPF